MSLLIDRSKGILDVARRNIWARYAFTSIAIVMLCCLIFASASMFCFFVLRVAPRLEPWEVVAISLAFAITWLAIAGFSTVGFVYLMKYLAQDDDE